MTKTSQLAPGSRSLNHWRVGRRHRISGTERFGMCTSVTAWGSNRIRWVRLALDDGTDRSFAPRELEVVER